MKNTVTLLVTNNSTLKAGIIFGLIFFLVAAYITIKTIIKNRKSNKKRQIFLISVGIIFCSIGIYTALLEYNLLQNEVYVEGTTIGICKDRKGRTGIEFEYFFNGEKFSNCALDYSVNEIKVPGGKFKVRVSDFDPSIGRIDFTEPLTDESRRK